MVSYIVKVDYLSKACTIAFAPTGFSNRCCGSLIDQLYGIAGFVVSNRYASNTSYCAAFDARAVPVLDSDWMYVTTACTLHNSDQLLIKRSSLDADTGTILPVDKRGCFINR